MNAPTFAEAWVVSQDPDNYGLFVSLSGPFGGAGPTLSVRVGTHGPRDGVTGHFPALPTAGTHGVVCFPRQDSRNGVWLCSTSTQLTDADNHQPGNGASDYAAHYGGGWSYRDHNGSLVEAFPDGTVIQAGPTLPAPTRHTIDGNQARQRTPFPLAQRITQPVSPFPLSIQHPTGASAVLTASGGWQITAASGQTVVLSVAGGAVFTVAGNNLTVASDATVTVTSSTAINLVAPAISATNGGAAIAVQLANSTTSTVFKAQ
jgi:hypothetical protein